MADIDLQPTQQMADNAARGLELREKHGKGGTAVGVARARDIKNRKNLSPETVKRMHSFFSRHEGNQAGGEDDAGYIAWLLWGGDAGKSWAKRKVEQIDGKTESARNPMPQTNHLQQIEEWHDKRFVVYIDEFHGFFKMLDRKTSQSWKSPSIDSLAATAERIMKSNNNRPAGPDPDAVGLPNPKRQSDDRIKGMLQTYKSVREKALRQIQAITPAVIAKNPYAAADLNNAKRQLAEADAYIAKHRHLLSRPGAKTEFSSMDEMLKDQALKGKYEKVLRAISQVKYDLYVTPSGEWGAAEKIAAMKRELQLLLTKKSNLETSLRKRGLEAAIKSSRPGAKAKAAKNQVDVDQRSEDTYEWVHRRRPKGRGSWAFIAPNESLVFVPGQMTYSEAKKWLKENAPMSGRYKVATQRPGSAAKFSSHPNVLLAELKYLYDRMEAIRSEFEELEARKMERVTYALQQAVRDGDQDAIQGAAAEIQMIKTQANHILTRHRFSRPGAKAKFGRAERQLPNGEVHLDFNAAKQWLSALPPEQLRYIMKDARAAADAMPDGKKFNYYHDLALTAGDILRNRMNASRPGAKAKFGLERTVNQILDDWGVDDTGWDWSGGRLIIYSHQRENILRALEYAIRSGELTKMPYHVFSDPEPYKSSRPGGKKKNDLTEACWEGYEAVGTKKKDGKTVPNCVPMSRPGAKTRFSWNRDTAHINEIINVAMRAISEGDMNKAKQALRDAQAALFNLHDSFSRPGAKAKFGDAEKLNSLLASVVEAMRRGDKSAAYTLMAQASREIDENTPAGLRHDYQHLKGIMSRPGEAEAFGFGCASEATRPEQDEALTALAAKVGREHTVSLFKRWSEGKASMSRQPEQV